MSPSDARSLPTAESPLSQRIHDLVVEIAQLARADVLPLEFQLEFLGRVVPALAALGGTFWVQTAARCWQREGELPVDGLNWDQVEANHRAHQELLTAVAASNSGMSIAPGEQLDSNLVPSHSNLVASNLGAGSLAAGNPSRFLLVLMPYTSANRVGVIEIVQRPEVSRSAQRGFLRFLEQLAALVADYYQRAQQRADAGRQHPWQQIDRFVRSIHTSLDVSTTAYTVANDGRSLIGCGRLSVVLVDGRRARIAAISGQDVYNPRSNVVKLMQRLARQVITNDVTVWSSDTESLPPQVEAALHEYLDESQARACGIVLLRMVGSPGAVESSGTATEQRPIGALVVDLYDAAGDESSLRQRSQLVADYAVSALANAQTYQSIFLLPLWRRLGQLSHHFRARALPKTVGVVLTVTAVMLALGLIETDFEVEGRGRLQPAERRVVFARCDGVVQRVHVAHGQQVERDQLLVELRNTALDYQLATVLGEIQTTQKKMSSAQAMLLTVERDSAAGRTRYTQLAAESEQLTMQLAGLDKRLTLLRQQQADLRVVSPLAGQIFTWDVAGLLADRPVTRGQALLNAANTAGPWVIEVLLPDRRMGHVRNAQQALGPGLGISYLLATEPGREHRATIQEVALSTEVDEEEGHTVLITAAVNRAELPEPRPGATVRARIHCGRRSLAYCWFHELIEFVQSRILFRW